MDLKKLKHVRTFLVDSWLTEELVKLHVPQRYNFILSLANYFGLFRKKFSNGIY